MGFVISSIFLSPDDLIVRTRWYVYLRWFILLVAIVPGIVSLCIGYGWGREVQSGLMFGVIALSTNAVFFILSRLLKNKTAVRALITTAFSIDIALITYFIYTKGGIESRSVLMYVIPIIMSAAIFGRKGVYASAFMSMLAYDILILCNYFGIFYSLDPFYAYLQTDFAYVVNTIIFFNALFILISMAVDFIAQLLISKERLATGRLNELVRAQSVAKFGSWEWKRIDDVINWSDELYDIFGVEKSSVPITFEQYMSYIHPDDTKLVNDEIRKAAVGVQSFSFDHRIVLPDGKIRYIYSNGQSYSDKKGVVTHMVGTARDITENKLLENAKNDFVAVTSHQLRTPATIVKQYTTMLAEGYVGELTLHQKQFLKTIYDSNERQIAIINDLLNIARIDSGHFNMTVRRTDVIEMLKQIKSEHLGKYKSKHQRLVFKPNYKNVFCNIDSGHIKMAMENLLDNAHKYTPANKTVRMDLKRRRKGVTITITDQGIGIPAKDIHKIFDMFSRVENPSVLQEEGTGIGLYWAKKIITMHGGTIDVTSEHNKGTTFSIYLPYKAAKD
ncbi:MAG: Sensor histidine kinase ResE [Candidatus Saccharibacteria bacterium]|nr:Sensor histidine kinase ResE [Candidatus Saccharibacteria bacterium]